MSRPRAPWWLYLLAASFLGFFVLFDYCLLWGPERLGVYFDYGENGARVASVEPGFAAERAGWQVGDVISAVDAKPLRSELDWNIIGANLRVGFPHRVELERAGTRLELQMTLARRSWRRLPSDHRQLVLWLIVTQLLTLSVALLIAFSRPRDRVALLGSYLLAALPVAIAYIEPPYGLASTWRQLPAPLQALLWIPMAAAVPFDALLLTFFCVFPRPLFRARWPWLLVWLPLGVPAVALLGVACLMVYRPERATGLLSQTLWRALFLLGVAYALAAVLALVVNYRRLEDLNERRRLRVLVAGSLVGWLAPATVILIDATSPRWGTMLITSPVRLAALVLSWAFPLSFAYAILRHRVFDIGVIIRQGLQYALARRLLVLLVPVLAALLFLDLLLHGEQPLVEILLARGWLYAVLGGLAVIAHAQRQRWLAALDRRFFRERYDAQRLLREVVEEIRQAGDLRAVAPRVVARVEAALHPEFAALLVREPHENSYRTLAAAPAGQAPPALPADSKLVALVRLLGKPLEVPQTETGWLREQLPHQETDFLRQARIELVVPVATAPDHTEALLVVGPKRSEEPYTREDQDMLVAIASSLALLLQKPAAAPPARVSEAFAECPQCGTCYDTGSERCAQERAPLNLVRLPRLLADRYRLERRLGRGGMGTVYAAVDTALERSVAVKLIREDLLGSEEAAERFRREARAAAGFTHPNVVTVHDFGVAAGQRAFLVMELLQGRSLREELREETRLAPARLVEILRGVCAAVEAAHRRSLLHRDLKPENIFLARGETGEVAKVLDFGVAKFLPTAQPTETFSPRSDATVDTGTALVGTYLYMAPEQLRGEAPQPSWDLWALAVLTYEILTGARPFGTAPGDWQSAVLAGRFTPLSAHLPEAAPGWQRFFERAFALEPQQRPASARSLLSDLERTFA